MQRTPDPPAANQVGTFVATLLRDPVHWDRLAADHDLVPSAVEELLRYNRLSDSDGAQW